MNTAIYESSPTTTCKFCPPSRNRITIIAFVFSANYSEFTYQSLGDQFPEFFYSWQKSIVLCDHQLYVCITGSLNNGFPFGYGSTDWFLQQDMLSVACSKFHVFEMQIMRCQEIHRLYTRVQGCFFITTEIPGASVIIAVRFCLQ